MEYLVMWGVPSALVGLVTWALKKYIDKRDADKLKREEQTQELILLMLNSNRANSVGISAIANAVARIPDAKCNGDIKSAVSRIKKQ